MKEFKIIVLFLSIFLFMGCEKDEMDIDDGSIEYKLRGTWGRSVGEDNYVIYQKMESLKENEYGFIFNPGHKFVERKNSGWCGTPPVVCSDYDGSWTLNDSIIKIKVGFWGGKTEYVWKIKSLDNERLIVENLPLQER